MIAYCGLNCDECPSYIGTITGDGKQLIKMNEEYGNEKTDPIDFVCLVVSIAILNLSLRIAPIV